MRKGKIEPNLRRIVARVMRRLVRLVTVNFVKAKSNIIKKIWNIHERFDAANLWGIADLERSNMRKTRAIKRERRTTYNGW